MTSVFFRLFYSIVCKTLEAPSSLSEKILVRIFSTTVESAEDFAYVVSSVHAPKIRCLAK